MKLSLLLGALLTISSVSYAQNLPLTDIQVEQGTVQENRKGLPTLTVRTLSLSGDLTQKMHLELEFPTWASQSGLRQNPTFGLAWSLKETDAMTLTLHPQYDFGNPALAAQRRLRGGGQNLVLPLEAEFGSDDRGKSLVSLGVNSSQSAGISGLYNLGFQKKISRQMILGTAIEGSGGQDMAHLNGQWSLAKKTYFTFDLANSIHRISSGNTRSLLSAGISQGF